MIRTAVIAAAGRGTRMGALSDSLPKPLVPICGQSFLHYVLESLRDIGCRKMIVVAGHHFEQMRDYIQQLPYPVTLIDQTAVVGDAYGTAVVVRAAASQINDEAFILYNADMLYHSSIMRTLHDDGYTHVAVGASEDPRSFGVVRVDADGFVQEVVEKPAQPVSTLINLGLYVCQPEVIDVAQSVALSPRGEYEFVDVLNRLAADRRVKADRVDGEWVTLTKPDDIPVIERFLAQDKRV